METLIVILLAILIGLVVFSITRSSRSGLAEEKIQSAIETTRSEMERSKDIISVHAVKTLETINSMGATLEKMMHHQKEVTELGNSLKYLLQTPKLRGNYGEEILEEMLERVVPRLWQRQFEIEGGERVDAVIKYKDIAIPIDAKFPREIYEKYLNAEREDDKKQNWKLYENGLRAQISSIRNKYIKPHKGTSDFALMFIPSESIYYETIAEKNFLGEPCGIYEYARNNKVVPVSPNTFYAFLQILIMGVRNLDIIKSARSLQEALAKIERNFKHFYAKYEDIGAALDKAQGAYKVGDTHIKRFKDNIDSTIKLDLPETPSSEEPK
ncbi:MAG: DNA recombination protein RmuC [Candidatus Omnitrophota bacterium]